MPGRGTCCCSAKMTEWGWQSGALSQQRRQREQEWGGPGRAVAASLPLGAPPAHPRAAQPAFGVCTAAVAARRPLAVPTPIQPRCGGEVSFLPP